MTKNTQQFDKLRRRFEKNGGSLQFSVHNGLAQFREAKTHAYRMAEDYLQMLQQLQPNLRDFVQKQGFRSKGCVDKYLEKWFAPMASMGDDWRELVHAVQEGMTQKQYLASGASVYCSKAKRKSDAATLSRRARRQPEPDESMPVEHQVEYWKTQATAVKAENRDLRSRLHKANNRIARLERAIERLHKIINAATAAA